MSAHFPRASTFGAALVAVWSAAIGAVASDEIRFDRDVRPILSANCFGCHGPDAANRQADLRLDTKDGLFADRGGYRTVVPNRMEDSELVHRITAEDPDMRMPPADSELQLTSDEIEILKRWVQAGAPWQEHWAFVTPVRPTLPAVKRERWVRTPIDRFVLAKLEASDLSPSPEADRRTLIRRVAFDVTGLPPRGEDVEAFLLDNSEEAYERVLDRLLASENYGEHRARYWLDLARYGDTHGLHLDNFREMWPFRDWVIQAFNRNLPHDRFLIEQLAGDLLPEPTLDQQVASGFIRNHVTTNEGGSIEEEVYVRNVVDCVDTLGAALLGLTLGCAVCHDHKYDPVTQKDYYQLFAFFNSLDGPPMDGNVKDPAPTVRVPSDEQAAELAQIRQEIAELRAQCDARLKDAAATQASFVKWLESLRSGNSSHADVELLHSSEDLVVQCRFEEGDGERVSDSRQPKKPGRTVGDLRWVEGRVGGGIEITEAGFVDLGKRGKFDAEQKFSFGAWVRVPRGANGTVLAKTETKEGIKGYDLSVLGDGRVSTLFSSRWPGYAIKVTTKDNVLKPDTWHHLFVTYDGSKVVQGVTFYVDGRPQECELNCDSLKSQGNFKVNNPLLVGRRDAGSALVGGRIDEVRMYDRRLTEAEVRAVYFASQLSADAVAAYDELTTEQREALRQLHAVRHDPVFAKLVEQIEKRTKELGEQELQLPTTLVYRERGSPRPAYVLVRGQYDQQGERVRRQTPPFLPPMADELPRDRLGLAQWLVSPEHPLTSRVAINQLWQQLFGMGLVETSEDFGSQGSPPSHPELLDWLAVEFRESGWDVKAMLKLIMMSATYRQTSAATPDLIERDPENRLLARGPRFRLDAEALRDQVLSVSGLLVNRIGGPSVKPPQPADLWHAVGYSGSNTVKFVADEGPDKIYRRSLYTFWKRTAPPPQMSILDAPSREACIARRERTNTPLQALLLMNEPQQVEAARRLAERVLEEGPESPRGRAAWAFEQAMMRPPAASELHEITAALHDFTAAYRADVEAARKLLSTTGGLPNNSEDAEVAIELATWTMTANLLFNLDEFLTKE